MFRTFPQNRARSRGSLGVASLAWWNPGEMVNAYGAWVSSPSDGAPAYWCHESGWFAQLA
jgi:hypothetical protein